MESAPRVSEPEVRNGSGTKGAQTAVYVEMCYR